MADQEAPDESRAPAPCQACRATGKIVSNLGGSPTEVQCPWCDGTGSFIAEHDAQDHWSKEDPQAAENAVAEPDSGTSEPSEAESGV